jgi:general secretion pathway protein N
MSRQRTRKPVVRRPRSLIRVGVLILMMSWVVALLLTAPITLVPVSRLALPSDVQLTPLNGTFWHGQWRLKLPQTPTMTIHTDFLPFSILRLQPAWHMRVETDMSGSQPDAGLNLAADVAPGFKQLRVRSLDGRLPAASPWIASLTAWPLGGTIDFKGDAVLTRTAGGLELQSAQVTANWQNAQITTTEPLSLGDLVLDAEVGHGQFNVTAKPASSPRGPVLGELTLTGLWPITKAPTVRGYLQPTPLASDALSQQLGLLGQPDASGKITIQGVLPGRY